MDSIGKPAMVAVERARAAMAGGSQQLPSTVRAPPPSTAKAPAYFDRTCDAELPRLLSAWIPDVGPREIMRALTRAERLMVEVRARALRTGTAGYLDQERNAVEADVAAMLGGFRSMRQQDDNAEGVVIILAGVLREFPLWAIREGCLKIARNEAGLNHRFAPNDTEIATVVREIVADYRKRLATAEQLLGAPVAPPRALPAPRPTQAEIEAKLGRATGPRPEVKVRPEPPTGKGGYAARVAADLRARRERNAAASPSPAQGEGG